MNTLLFVLVNILLIVAGYVMAFHYSHRNSITELLLKTFLLVTSQITVTLLFLGIVVRNMGIGPITLLNGSISLFTLFLCRHSIGKAWRDFWHRNTTSTRELFQSRDYFLFLLLVLFFMQVLALLVKIYYFPADVWDVFAYHLHPVVEWVQQNMIPSMIDTPVTRLNRNPMGPKLLHFWFVKYAGHLTWVELPQFFYGLVMLFTSYVLMQKMQIQRLIALRYAILIYFIPSIIIESRTAQDHLVLASVTLLMILYFINIIWEKQARDFIFLGLAMGQILGAKISGPQVIFILFPALLCTLGFKWAKIGLFLKSYWQYIVMCLLITLIGGGYWYLKDFSIIKSYFGVIKNIPFKKVVPVAMLMLAISAALIWLFKRYAYLLKKLHNKKLFYIGGIVLGIVLLAGAVKHGELIKIFVLGKENPKSAITNPILRSQYPIMKYIHSRFAKNLLMFPFRIKDIGMYTEYTPDFLDQSGFGIQFFVFGVLAYFIMGVLFFFRKKHRHNAAGFLFIYSILLLGSYFVYYYSVANYRLFIFFPVIGIMLWAYLFNLWEWGIFQRVFLDILLLGMVLFNIGVTIFEGHRDPKRLKFNLTASQSLERTTIQYSSFFTGDDWKTINLYIPPAEPIGYLGHFDSWVFPYFDNEMQRRIFHLRSLEGFNLLPLDERKSQLILDPTFKAELRKRGIHYLHINPQGVRDREELKKKKSIFIHDQDVCVITDNLYYYKWE